MTYLLICGILIFGLMKWLIKSQSEFDNRQPRRPRQAWFSQKAAAQNGTVIYRRDDGTHVAVTEVADPGTPPVSKWPDMMDCGEVVEFVTGSNRAILHPQYQRYPYNWRVFA